VIIDPPRHAFGATPLRWRGLKTSGCVITDIAGVIDIITDWIEKYEIAQS
jgi:hypothetical protein